LQRFTGAYRKEKLAKHQWLMIEILAILEAEIRRIVT
jgi:hypothetical protein